VAKPKKEPKYRRQKGKHEDRAFVELSGQRIYLGQYGSPESREKYHRQLAEWNASGRELPTSPEEATVVELIARFVEYAEVHYRREDGSLTGTAENYRPALKLLRKHYGDREPGRGGVPHPAVRRPGRRGDWRRPTRRSSSTPTP